MVHGLDGSARIGFVEIPPIRVICVPSYHLSPIGMQEKEAKLTAHR